MDVPVKLASWIRRDEQGRVILPLINPDLEPASTIMEADREGSGSGDTPLGDDVRGSRAPFKIEILGKKMGELGPKYQIKMSHEDEPRWVYAHKLDGFEEDIKEYDRRSARQRRDTRRGEGNLEEGLSERTGSRMSRSRRT
jgi:hypothetical protein